MTGAACRARRKKAGFENSSIAQRLISVTALTRINLLSIKDSGGLFGR
jgi:hypothetical protein